jgi:hypothetical protein
MLAGIIIRRPQGSKPRTSDAGKNFTGFPRHNFAKDGPWGQKNGLERRVWPFYTACDKNQLLKVKIEKFTVFLVLRSWDANCLATSGSAEKFV